MQSTLVKAAMKNGAEILSVENVCPNTIKYTQAGIKELLIKSNKAVEHSILAIYKLQTPDEQGIGITYYKNHVGFSGVHAEFASSLAEQLKKGAHLSNKQLLYARKIMLHYTKQLVAISNKTLEVK